MEIIFKVDNSIIKMKDRIDQEGVYITTSTINGVEKTIIKKYDKKEEAEKILENIFLSIEKGIKEQFQVISIIL